MDKAEIYLAYEETIKKGWFRSKIDELSHLLEVLELNGRITPGEREELLSLAKELETGGRDSSALAY